MNFNFIKKSSLVLLILNLISLASAFSLGGWGYYSPSYLLQNEWVMFGALFVLFFAIVFFAVGRTFKENKGVAIVVSLVVSLFITLAVERRGLIYSYAGEELGGYLLIFALIIGVILIFKAITSLIGGIGLFLCLAGLWFILNKTYYSSFFYDSIPYSLLPVYEFIAGGNFIIWLIVALIAVIAIAYTGDGKFNKAVKRWLWNKKKKSWKDLLED